jgi:hypothetical protein
VKVHIRPDRLISEGAAAVVVETGAVVVLVVFINRAGLAMFSIFGCWCWFSTPMATDADI